MSSRLANMLLLLAGAVWGMGFVAQETAMQDMGPMLFVGVRFLLAALVVLPFALREQFRLRGRFSVGRFLEIIPVGMVFFTAMATQQTALLATSVTNAGFLTALYVVLVPFILFFVLREPQPPIIWPAAFIAIAGIYLLGGGNLSTLTWGDWLVVVSACFWAVHVILVGKVGVRTGMPVTLAAIQFFICGLLGLAGHWLSFRIGLPEPLASWENIGAALPEILYAALFAGGLAFTLQAIAQRHTSEAAAAILLSSEALFAALFGALLLGERLSFTGYLGCVLIFLSLLMVEFKDKFKRLQRNT